MGLHIIFSELQKDLTIIVCEAQSRRVQTGPPLSWRQADGLMSPRSRPRRWSLRKRQWQVWNLAKYLSKRARVMCIACACSVFTCVFFTCLYSCNSTFWRFSMMISTTMFWNLMFIMAATVSSCDLISVGPKIIPKLDTVIRFWLQWLDILNNQETGL